MLKGRLGLDTARIPHADRAGVLHLSHGALTARNGTFALLRGSEPARCQRSLGSPAYTTPILDKEWVERDSQIALGVIHGHIFHNVTGSLS